MSAVQSQVCMVIRLTFFLVPEFVYERKSAAQLGKTGLRKCHGIIHQAHTIIDGEWRVDLGGFVGDF